MGFFKRVSQLVKTNLYPLLDRSEDPDESASSAIREMERKVLEIQKETVRAVAREKQLEKQLRRSAEQLKEYEEKAGLALKEGGEVLAGQILAEKFRNEREREVLKKEFKTAFQAAARLRSELAELENQLQWARRKREELLRRKQSAQEQLRAEASAANFSERPESIESRGSTLPGSHPVFEAYENAVIEIEAEAEANQMIFGSYSQDPHDLELLSQKDFIEKELERLKKEFPKS